MKQDIVEKIRAAGVVGAGGAGFPTHVKFGAEVSLVLANGASCEPLLASDPYLLEHETESILNGLKAAMTAVGAPKGMVCLKSKHGSACAVLETALKNPDYKNIEIFLLNDVYPAGDEQVLVYEVTGRVVPEGGIPLQVGVVVSNVESLHNVALALEDKPVTHRYLTVTGEVERPVNLHAPIGTAIKDVIQAAGGVSVQDHRVVIGGPMMGQVVDDTDLPVTKTSSGVIVLPANHNVAMGKIMDPERVRNLARVACCQCSRCTDLCPRHLLGHSLEVHKIMRQLGSPLGLTQEVMLDALICSECGICEKFACPMMLSPREVNTQIKRELFARGVKRSPKQDAYRPSSFRNVRYLPTSRLMARLQVSKFDVHPEFLKPDISPDRVDIPLRQHIGAPALAVVEPGDTVKAGDLIGEIPEKKLGARVHASIGGRVVSVGENIVIERT